MKKVLVTGGMGFIGSHVAENLAAAGYQVTIFDARRVWKLKGKINFTEGDITDFDQVKRAVAGQDGIVHLAAVSKISSALEDPLGCMRTNVMGTMNILESARKNETRPWIILTSTRETSSSESSQANGTFRKIENLYGISKLVGEIVGERYAIDYKSRVLTLKLSDVYGSVRDNPRKVLSRLVIRALSHRDLLIQHGEQEFDFTHWRDVSNSFLSAVKNVEQSKESFYDDFAICTGKKTSLKELARLVIRETKSNSRVEYFELNVKASHKFFTSPKKAKNILGFKAGVSLPNGIREAVKLWREQLKKDGIDRFKDILS